ncbi:MAG TPA: serine hydrolase domain-containing protein [Candidatus Kapabacteria bacterium]|nr:serine hydrolase domain-containing protein [Candidatus Kapabacteria bacterium]
MNKYLLFFLMIILSYACSEDSTTSADYSQKFPKIQSMIDSIWNSYLTEHSLTGNFGIAMQLSVGNQAKFFKSNFDETITEHSHFRIASNTKVFTAAALMLLHERGKLNINDKITDTIPNTNDTYLPNTTDYNIPFKDKMTIRQLMQHIAGVFDIGNDAIPDTVQQDYKGEDYIAYTQEKKGELHSFTIDEMIKVLAETQIYNFEPGKAYYYSNTGYQILAKIIERVSGKSYSDFITEKLFQINSLNETSSPYLGTDVQIPEPFIPGYFLQDSTINVTERNHSMNIAEGNIISTPSDMVKWIKLFIKGEAGVSSSNISIMKDYTNFPDHHYGLGILHIPEVGYGHNGATIGYLSYCLYNPDTDVAICLCTNSWNYSNGTESIKAQLNILNEICFKANQILKN